jgi:hypothetical protein
MEKVKSSVEARPSTVNLKMKKQRFTNALTSLTTPTTLTLTNTHPKLNFSNTAKPAYKNIWALMVSFSQKNARGVLPMVFACYVDRRDT